MSVDRFAALVVVLSLVGSAGAACTGDAAGPEGALEQALARARAPAEAANDAARRPATRTTSRLELAMEAASGPSMTVSNHALVIDRRVDEDALGRFRVRDSRLHRSPSAADPAVPEECRAAIEAVFDGHALAMRVGEGEWIERAVLDGLPARTLARASDLAGFVTSAWADYLQYRPLAADERHPGTVGGQRVSWVAVGVDPAVRPRALPAAELISLRDHDPSLPLWVAATHRPTRIEGELARTEAGAVVAGTLRVEGDTALSEGNARFVVTLSLAVDPLPAEADFTLPEERLPESRERPWQMIEDVLGEGLLPPYDRP